jgi:hypothetical protein
MSLQVIWMRIRISTALGRHLQLDFVGLLITTHHGYLLLWTQEAVPVGSVRSIRKAKPHPGSPTSRNRV